MSKPSMVWLLVLASFSCDDGAGSVQVSEQYALDKDPTKERKELEEKLLTLLAVEEGTLQGNYRVVDDKEDFVSPFTGGKANKKKFLALRGLSFADTVKTIRADGVAILFVNTKKGSLNNPKVRELNGKVDDDTLVTLEISLRFFNLQMKRQRVFDRAKAFYSIPSNPVYDLEGNNVESPLTTPSIVVDLMGEKFDDVATLQHEYLHHLFESRRDKFKLDQVALVNRGNRLAVKRDEALERSTSGKAAERLAARREYWQRRLEVKEFESHNVLYRSVKEWDAIWVQLITRNEMALTDGKATGVLEYMALTGQEMATHIGVITTEVGETLPNLTVLDLAGLKCLIRLIEMQHYLGRTVRSMEQFVNLDENQPLLKGLSGQR